MDTQAQLQPIDRPPKMLDRLVELMLLLALIPTLFSLPVRLVLLRHDAYRQAIQAQRLDERLAGLLAGWLTRSAPDSELRQSLSYLPQEQLAKELSLILPRRWAEEEAFNLVDHWVSWLNSDGEIFRLPVSLEPLKRAIETHDQQMADAIVASWPPCSLQDVLDLGILAMTGELADIPYCQPPDAFQPLVSSFVRQLLRLSIGALPESVDIVRLLPVSPPQSWGAAYRVVRTLLVISPLAAALIAVLVFAAVWPDRRRAIGLIGWSLMTAGAAGFLLFAFGVAAAIVGLPLLPAGYLSLIPLEFREILWSTLQLIALRFAITQLIWLLMALILGLLLFRLTERKV